MSWCYCNSPLIIIINNFIAGLVYSGSSFACLLWPTLSHQWWFQKLQPGLDEVGIHLNPFHLPCFDWHVIICCFKEAAQYLLAYLAIFHAAGWKYYVYFRWKEFFKTKNVLLCLPPARRSVLGCRPTCKSTVVFIHSVSSKAYCC